LDTAIPEAMRAFAGTAVSQSREAYERAKTTLDAGLEAMERSYDAANRATAALNRKIIDIAQCNVNSGFDLAKSLASAKNGAAALGTAGFAGVHPQIHPSAAAVARLAAPRLAAGEGVDAAHIAPIYLRDKVALTTEERRNR
jgi:tRNA A37 threonylcarbamoyladenosine modification protein TsaB